MDIRKRVNHKWTSGGRWGKRGQRIDICINCGIRRAKVLGDFAYWHKDDIGRTFAAPSCNFIPPIDGIKSTDSSDGD